MEDRQIVALLREEPSEGLRAAIHQYGGLLYTVISRILPDKPQDVEECMADTFVNMWKTVGRLTPDSSVKGYLLCIARNVAITRYHHLKKQNHLSLSALEIAAKDDVALDIVNEETFDQLQELIVLMTEPDREMLVRKYFLFESYRQIGARLGMTAEQVKGRLYRSRRRLKAALEERGIDYDAI